ncbi:6-bladed beta-propeller [Algoriphagus marinus]|uniref:6-bladed beta-propeller n=1 Tax=Algoriphagus marinus TaxID=1925762 RepID=UPI00094B7EAC|nr:6-bladed beta-propeller [Algoriphagus marinus]
MTINKFWGVLIASLFLFSACERQKDEVTETGNSKFLSFVGSDSLSTEFIYSESDPVVLNLDENQIDAKIKLSDLMTDYRLLSLKNWDGGVVGDIDKILLSDSLVFILDQYTYNSLQIFDLFTGEQVGQFIPTGEGPGEMKSISEFDLDEANRRILIYDNSLAKVLSFSFEGDFLSEKRLPLRAHSFKIFPGNQLFFSSFNNGNGHLGKTAESDIFLLDSNFIIRSTFKYPKIDQMLSNYVPRDVIRENGGVVTYFPRFSNELLKVDVANNTISPIFQVNLEAKGLSEKDFGDIGPEFISERKEDKKFYGFGLHFVSPTWMGMKFNRFGGPELHVYYNKTTGDIISGTGLEFDFEDLIFYSFPLACVDQECVSFIRLGGKQYKDYEEIFKKEEGSGRDFTKVKKFLESVEDFEQPVLLIFKLKD